MMLSQSFFIPLYFEEVEADLWQALQQIEPENRSAFIKATLRQVLIDEDKAEASIDSHSLEDESEEIEEIKIEEFSLEALFAEAHVLDPGADYVGLANYEEVRPTLQSVPWDYLLNNVIGVEDDEAVIAAIKQIGHSEVQEGKSNKSPMKIKRSEPPADELDGQLARVGDQEFDLESLHVDTHIPSTGFEYMMKHIIGIEEDEAVLKAITSGFRDLKEEKNHRRSDLECY